MYTEEQVIDLIEFLETEGDDLFPYHGAEEILMLYNEKNRNGDNE